MEESNMALALSCTILRNKHKFSPIVKFSAM